MICNSDDQYCAESFSNAFTISFNSSTSGFSSTRNVPSGVNPIDSMSYLPPKAAAILFWKALPSVFILLNLSSLGSLMMLSKYPR